MPAFGWADTLPFLDFRIRRLRTFFSLSGVLDTVAYLVTSIPLKPLNFPWPRSEGSSFRSPTICFALGFR